MNRQPPSLGLSVNAVLDAFKAIDAEWSGGLAVVEANDTFGLNYRWMPAVYGGHLGVSENDGVTLRRASDAEYSALEEGLATGSVSIILFNRVSRETKVLHQATGKPMPMD
jgi:hypothetical protein